VWIAYVDELELFSMDPVLVAGMFLFHIFIITYIWVWVYLFLHIFF
jgi:hypothetical protein